MGGPPLDDADIDAMGVTHYVTSGDSIAIRVYDYTRMGTL